MSSADSQFAATQSAALRAGALRKWLAGWMGGGAGRGEGGGGFGLKGRQVALA